MDVINVLWTGGWDSTYRVLELLLIENQSVRPYYVVAPHPSLAHEILAMAQIRHRIEVSFPDQAARLLQVQLVHCEAVPQDEEITKWFHRMKSLVHIGNQYEGLALFAKYYVTEPELCIERVSSFDEGLLIFRDFVRPLLRGKGHECRIEGPFPEPAVQMFKYFRFPITHLTKADMRKISEEEGFLDIMKLTWFCHFPKNGLPCGKCRPCLMAPASGLEYPFYKDSVWDKIAGVRNRFLFRPK